MRCWKWRALPFILLIWLQGFSLQPVAPAPLSGERLMIDDVFIQGNHKTRRPIVLAELPFQIGEQIEASELSALLTRAKENLQNTSLFNQVELVVEQVNRYHVVVHIELTERWYLWVFPLFESEGRNFSDFLRLNDGSYFNYGLYLKHDNFRGRRERLRLRMVTGYKKQLVFDYQKPSINKKSGWGMNVTWLWNDQVPYATEDDKQLFLKTLGNRLMTRAGVQLSYAYRHRLDHHHRVYMGYVYADAADTLLQVNPDFLPGGAKKSETLELAYNYALDRRDSKVYPLRGYRVDFEFARKGFGVLSDDKGFFQSRLSASWQTGLWPRFYVVGSGALAGIDQTAAPYIFRTGLGYEDYLNGFEYHVIDGSAYGILQSKLLFELLPRRDHYLKWIPLEQFARFHYAFYLKAFIDGGYVINEQESALNKMANEMLLGYGLGLDMVTFYDKVLSLNYSFNNFAEHRLYFHFNLSF